MPGRVNPSAVAAAPAGRDVKGKTHVGRVLVVDDDDLVRYVIGRHLELSGFEVRKSGDGLDALAAAEAFQPDVILTDLNMPRCDGLRLLEELRGRSVTAAIPVVLMTGEPVDAAPLLAIGYSAVIHKPLPPEVAQILAGFIPQRHAVH